VQLIAFLILATLVGATHAPPCQYLYIDEQSRQLLTSDGEGARPLLEDPDGVHLPRWSPDGRSVAYVNDFKEYPDDVVTFVVVRDLSTLAKKRMPLTLDEHVIAVQQLGWKGADKVWIEGRFGPRSATYIEWNAVDGKRTNELLGTKFSYSATGTLAYVDHDPAPASKAPAILVIGDSQVYKASARIRSLVWAPDGSSIGLIEDTDSAQRLRVVSSEGKVLRTSERLSIAPESIAWSSPIRLAVWNSKDAFEMNTVSGALERTAAGVKSGLAAHDMIERNRNGHARKLTAADVRCGNLDK
jgi:dipeptidyl aminopeptidase/acylaminoacyl peptidase